MSEPFVAEIKMTGTNFAQRGWAKCDGQLLSISQNTALFSLIGTTYGGDGRTTVGLPDLRGRAPMHPGSGPGLTQRRLGEKGGTQAATLTTPAQMGDHGHTMKVVGALGDQSSPVGNSLAQSPSGRGGYGLYDDVDNQGDMAGDALTTQTGGNQAHENRQPSLAVNFQIALTGIFPS